MCVCVYPYMCGCFSRIWLIKKPCNIINIYIYIYLYVYPDFYLQVQAGQLRVSNTPFLVEAQTRSHTHYSPPPLGNLPSTHLTIYIHSALHPSIHPSTTHPTQTHSHGTSTHSNRSGGVVSRG